MLLTDIAEFRKGVLTAVLSLGAIRTPGPFCPRRLVIIPADNLTQLRTLASAASNNPVAVGVP